MPSLISLISFDDTDIEYDKLSTIHHLAIEYGLAESLRNEDFTVLGWMESSNPLGQPCPLMQLY